MPCSYVRDRFFVAALKSDKVRKKPPKHAINNKTFVDHLG